MTEDFSAELSAFVEQLIEEQREARAEDNDERWKEKLIAEVSALTEKYWSKPQFVVGDDTSSAVFEDSVDADDSIVPSSPVAINLPRIEDVGTDESILKDLHTGRLKHRELETKCSPMKSVELRRKYVETEVSDRWNLNGLPYKDYDYSWVNGACCENIIGYVPIPTGVAGPLLINDELFYIPMSTTEGALIASTNRGCKAVNDSGGVISFVNKDGMTRAPIIRFKTAIEAHKCELWVKANFEKIKASFEKTSRYARLLKVKPKPDGNRLFLKFVATTGDAMGMNMVTKGATEAVQLIQKQFPNSILETISGNMCSDKKASAINWIEGRGKSVIAEAVISAEVVKRVLKTSVEKMVDLATSKLLIGALNSVSIGGSNAHAANMVAAIFLATGQDAAQVVSSSMCSTQLSRTEHGDLYISCTMNCLEIGTVGGGTILSPQQTCLSMLGCCGPSDSVPGDNARRLAQIICSTVLAGELSLLASQCTGDLVRSHLRLNRSSRDLASSSSAARGLLSIPEEIDTGLTISASKPRSHSNSLVNKTGKVVKEVKRSMCDQSFH